MRIEDVSERRWPGEGEGTHFLDDGTMETPAPRLHEPERAASSPVWPWLALLAGLLALAAVVLLAVGL